MIDALDARHGTRPGYIAGCRQDCCRAPHIRYQKWSRLRNLRDGNQLTSSDRVTTRLDWWARYGVSITALHVAANLGGGTLAEVSLGYRDVIYKGNEAKLLAVTWADLPSTGLCNAELTRARIHSLMAAGHPLAWIVENVEGLSVGGRWRRQEKVTLRLARGVRELYERAPLDGPSLHTATKARRRGFLHPIAWDDPGTPAAPTGWQQTAALALDSEDIDPVVVMRLLEGVRIAATKAEKEAALERWVAGGGTERELCTVHGWKAGRYTAGLRLVRGGAA